VAAIANVRSALVCPAEGLPTPSIAPGSTAGLAPTARAARLTAQLLAGPRASGAVAVVDHLLAVQAQDPRGFRLAIRSRTAGLTVDDVDCALAERALVVTWLNRGTLHLVTARDYWWLHALTAPRQRATNRRRLEQEGVTDADARRGVTVIADAVTGDGPLTRAQLRARLDDAGVRTEGQALVHVLAAASIEGAVVRGPVVGREQAFVSTACWLEPAPPPLDRDDTLALLATRYLVGHAPATPDDLASWAGISLGDARRAFVMIDHPATSRRDRGRVRRAEPRLLGPFDPLLHGWRSRDWVLGRHEGVVVGNGVFRPIALVDDRGVATWRLVEGVPTVRVFEPFDPRARRGIERDASDILRFLRLPDRAVVWAEAH
jgi:hypothetical protein